MNARERRESADERGGASAEARGLKGARRDEGKRWRRKVFGSVMKGVLIAATLVALVLLVVLLYDVWTDGSESLSADFITSFPSRFASRAGILPALLGSLWIIAITAVVSFPLGVATAIWLEEYAPRNRLRTIIQTNIANLAGVPSIVYGILGLAVFVRAFALGRSIMAGALTLVLLILPVIVIAAQEAIRAVPNSYRLGAYALGATRWQTTRHHVLPAAMPGILTGTILALSRAIGETAPLIMIGAVGFVSFKPQGVLDQFTVLPIQIFDWVSRPQPEFHALAAAGIIVLLAVLLSMNLIAILLRNYFQRRNEG